MHVVLLWVIMAILSQWLRASAKFSSISRFFLFPHIYNKMQNNWTSAVVDESDQYHGGHGFESSGSPDFLGASSFQLLNFENLPRWSFFTFTFKIQIKVAQNSFQHIPKLRFWCVIITTLCQLMLQSWYQNTAQSLVNTLILFSWRYRLP